jgi:hypothetical protein
MQTQKLTAARVSEVISSGSSLSFDHNRHFDTFAATVQHYDTYSAVSIDRTCCCCGRSETIQRFIRVDAEEIQNEAVNCTRQLNSGSIMNFLRYRRRNITLCSVFTWADSLGLILTRPLFISAKLDSDPRHPLKKYPGVLRLSSDRFIACCKILERYGAFYSIGHEMYVSMPRGF